MDVYFSFFVFKCPLQAEFIQMFLSICILLGMSKVLPPCYYSDKNEVLMVSV